VKVAGRPLIFGRPAMLGLHSIPNFILHFMQIVEEGRKMKGGEIKIKYANSGRRLKNEI
jgi:hypothetical protein